jgi:hypothetical protein
MRDVGKLVGNAAMLSYVVNIVATNNEAMKSHIREAGVCVCAGCQVLQWAGRRMCCACQHLDMFVLTLQAADATACAVAEVCVAAHPACVGTCAGLVCCTTGGPADPTPSELSQLATAACCKLEGGLYAANVVLGRMCDVSNPELVDVLKLLDYAADVATHHTSEQQASAVFSQGVRVQLSASPVWAVALLLDAGDSSGWLLSLGACCAAVPASVLTALLSHCPAEIHKLAGTALTLIGGLPAWLVEHTAGLPAVLTAATTALRSPDDKLARNAATCMQRLTANEELASLLFATQPMHVQELLQEYQRRGGLPVTLRESCRRCSVSTARQALMC